MCLVTKQMFIFLTNTWMSKLTNLMTVNTKYYEVRRTEIKTKSNILGKVAFYFKFYSNACSAHVFVTS